jgi:beta-lactamase regulating signal transducer with metallopeptidase domain
MIHDLASPAGAPLLALSWLTTYLLHSTVMLGAVWLLVLARAVHEGLQEMLWKLALAGGLATATWQMVSDVPPYAGTVQLAQRPAAAAPAADRAEPPRAAARLAVAAPRAPLPEAPAAAAPARAASRSGSAFPWTTLVLLGYAGCVGVGLLQLAWGRRCFHRLTGGRRLVTAGDLPLQLLRLLDAAGYRRAVRLTTSARLATPIAFGFRQPEICLPERALTELRADEQESMLAHELAHLIHRDPAWLLVCQVLQRVFFAQPLHWVARAHLLRLAEYRCDAWAATHAREPLSLARCLLEVACWHGTPAPPALAHAPGMAARRSQLRQRVCRILDDVPAPRRVRLAAPVSTALLAIAAAALPSASFAPQPARPAPPLPPLVMLDTGPGLVALNDELRALDAEIAHLRATLARSAADPVLRERLGKLERCAAALRHRRDRLQAVLPAALDALAPSAPAPHNLPSSNQSGEQR